jgi:hypothetical protein
MTYTKQEMYDCLFKTVYLTMVEQFLPNLKQAVFVHSHGENLLISAESSTPFASLAWTTWI